MSAERRFAGAAWVLLIAVTTVYVAWGVFPDSSLYRDVLTPHVLLATASSSKRHTPEFPRPG